MTEETHALHNYLAGQLDDMLERRAVVVFYDPRREFEPFFDRELEPVGSGDDGLSCWSVNQHPTAVVRFEGSFFGLRALVEPMVARDRPERLIVYLPGVTRDRQGSVLMELEKGGACYEPQLRRLALNVLRQRFTDGQIDEMLRPAGVGYDDIAAFLSQTGGAETASVLRTLFRGSGSAMASEKLLARWLADDGQDAAIIDKDATPELLKLVETRLGLALPGDASLTDARERTLRYVLVSEFRCDLQGEAPACVGMVPEPPGRESEARLCEVAETLRSEFPERYRELADKVESDLGLANAGADAAQLGSIDTFRFEERALLALAGERVVQRDYDGALAIVAGRSHSFWVDQEVERQAQWEACRLMAELGQAIERVRPALDRCPKDPARWVDAYADPSEGWFRVDALQRQLETWVARMDEEPETERGLAVIRQQHEALLKRMAGGFAAALQGAGWSVAGALHQTRVYPEVVQPLSGRVAYFLVDAMRFEMGIELARQLDGTEDLSIRPAVAALPSITPVGMAALLPGASASFSVVDHKGELAARIDGLPMPGIKERLKFLKAQVPGMFETTLGNLLGKPVSRLGKGFAEAPLVVVRSQEIDFIGEMDGDLLARQVMDSVVGNLARAVKKLAKVGIESFVITADHGHQFAVRKDDDMKTDKPGGDTLDLHRRCWIGHGGTTPPGCIRASGAELGYDTNLDFVFPTGLGVFKAGGGLSFHHGSCSLQELVIPVLSLRMKSSAPASQPGLQVGIDDYPATITNRTFGLKLRLAADMLTSEAMTVRVLLVSGSEEVGRAGMVVGAALDRAKGTLELQPDSEASVGMMLTNDDCSSLRVVVQDPATDAVLTQSDELPVKLGI